MAGNFVQPGEKLTFTAPYAVASGAGFKVGAFFAVALAAAASGAPVEGKRTGVWDLAKTTGEAWTAFTTKLYWDDTAKKLTSTAGSNLFVGYPAASAASADTVGRAFIHGQLA